MPVLLTANSVFERIYKSILSPSSCITLKANGEVLPVKSVAAIVGTVKCSNIKLEPKLKIVFASLAILPP